MISFDRSTGKVNLSPVWDAIGSLSSSVMDLNNSISNLPSDVSEYMAYYASINSSLNLIVSSFSNYELISDAFNSSVLTDYAKTSDIGEAVKYQINMSDVKSDYNLECLYNLTGGSYTVSKQNSKHYSFGGLGIDSFSYYENSNCTFEGIIKSFLNTYMSGGSNTFSNIKITNLSNVRMRRVFAENASINFNNDSIYSVRISNHGNFFSNTFPGYIYLTNTGSINSNTIDGNVFYCTINGGMRSNIFTSSVTMNVFAENLYFASNSITNDATARLNLHDKKGITVYSNSIKYGWIDAENAEFYGNTFSGIDTLNVSKCSLNSIGTITKILMNNGGIVAKNTISSIRYADLTLSNFTSNDISTLDFINMDASIYFGGNTFAGSKVNITLTNFTDNSLSIDELNVRFRISNPSFTGNSISVNTFSVNSLFTDYFTNNSFTINNVLDFNYESSNVYDASLNYLLSDYVDESKVLGKYNLVPYVRSLSNSISTMTGGGGNNFVSICAHDSNISLETPYWPNKIDFLKLNLMNIEHDLLWSGGVYSNGTISRMLVNNWELDSASYGMWSCLSLNNVLIKSLSYNRLSNTKSNTGSLLSGSNYTIEKLYYTHYKAPTDYTNATSDSYVLARDARISSFYGSFNNSWNIVGKRLLFSDTIDNFFLLGGTPYYLADSCSIKSFYYRSFESTSRSPLTFEPLCRCTIDCVYFASDSIYTDKWMFESCSIKNAFVVCTPLAWDMSSAQFRASMASAFSGGSNITTDVVPMTFMPAFPA